MPKNRLEDQARLPVLAHAPSQREKSHPLALSLATFSSEIRTIVTKLFGGNILVKARSHKDTAERHYRRWLKTWEDPNRYDALHHHLRESSKHYFKLLGIDELTFVRSSTFQPLKIALHPSISENAAQILLELAHCKRMYPLHGAYGADAATLFHTALSLIEDSKARTTLRAAICADYAKEADTADTKARTFLGQDEGRKNVLSYHAAHMYMLASQFSDHSDSKQELLEKSFQAYLLFGDGIHLIGALRAAHKGMSNTTRAAEFAKSAAKSLMSEAKRWADGNEPAQASLLLGYAIEAFELAGPIPIEAKQALTKILNQGLLSAADDEEGLMFARVTGGTVGLPRFSQDTGVNDNPPGAKAPNQMGTGANIRRAVTSDTDLLAKIHAEAVFPLAAELLPKEVAASALGAPQPDYWASVLANPDLEVRLLSRDGDSLGFIVFGKSPDEDTSYPRTAEIWDIYVLPTFLRSGIASTLVTDALSTMANSKVSEVIAWCALRNTAGGALWTNLGFAPDGATKESPFMSLEVDGKSYEYQDSFRRYKLTLDSGRSSPISPSEFVSNS